MLIIQPSDPKGARSKYRPSTDGFKVTHESLINLTSPPPEAEVSYRPPKYTALRKSKNEATPTATRWAPSIEVTLYLSYHWNANIEPKLVSSNLSGPNIEW